MTLQVVLKYPRLVCCFVLFFSAFAAVGLEQAPAPAPLPHVFAYRGFQIDTSLIAERADDTSILASAKQQVDIVLSVNLKPDIVDFFRNYRVTLVPDLAAHGRYSTNGIELSASATPSTMPVLLHEYLHAFHERKLPGGRANLEVLSYYRRAKGIAAYPPEAYTLRNPSEFFAMTASAYLYGRIARPPCSRAAVKAAQPYYYRYLGEVFGLSEAELRPEPDVPASRGCLNN